MGQRMQTYEEHLAKFWASVQVGGLEECWEWEKARSKKGYGVIRWMGVARNAHKLAWELTHGLVPDGLCVLHSCDNPPCVNERHLFLGTIGDNNRDMFKKKRWAPRASRRGESNSNAALSNEQAFEIRRLYQIGDFSMKRLGERFGVGPTTVLDIVWGRRYA